MSRPTPASPSNGQPSPSAPAGPPGLVIPGGEMGARLLSLDWSATPLGPAEDWPQPLSTSLGLCLDLPTPAFLWWGPDLVLLYNDAGRLLLGDSHPADLGRPARACRSGLAQAAVPLLQGVLLTGHAATDPTPHDGPEGRSRFTLTHTPVRDESGGVGGVLTLAAESCRPSDAERELRASEERYRDLFENANDVIYTLDLDGRITSLNKRAEQTFGYPLAECLGRDVREIIPPEYHARMYEALRRKLGGEPAPTTYELEVVSRDGGRVPLEVSSRLILRDGTPVGIQGIARDVTDRRRAEAERERLLKEREAERAFLEAVLRQMPGGVVIAEAPSGKIVLRNASGPSLLPAGAKEPGHVGHYASFGGLFTNPRYAGPEDWPLLRSLRTGEEVQGEEMDFRRADGGRGTLRASSMPVRDPQGNIVAAVATWFDITQRKALEEALQQRAEQLAEADRRKDEFLALLAHELRNPLAPIRNATQLLQRLGEPHPGVGPLREIIERQVTHLARLVDDLLDVSRISSAKVLLRKERLDLAALVRAVTADHRPLLLGGGLRLAVEVPDRPLWVDGDPTRLAQVVGNLLHNAGKFTDPGGLVTVRLAPGPDGGRATLTVCDTGIGLEADILGRLFEPFSQADRSLARSQGGLGLGLALVKGLVELHGGGVEAASAGPGRGAEFTVCLPLAPGPAEQKRPPGGPGPKATLRILVVEDNRDTAATLRLLLEMEGHEVAVAHNGTAGVAAARGLWPDVVLCDIGLPGGMDGYGVARALRADPEQAVATLIALTGYGQEEDRRQARQAGFDRHLTKPVDPVVLMQLLATLPVRPGR
jgi:PAS domain S-box-containing protein